MDFREKIVHGNESLPLAVYEVMPSHVRYRMINHWHPEHEIVYVQKGSMCLHAGDAVYNLSKGDVLFIGGGIIHSGEPENCEYTCFLVNFSGLMKKSDVCTEFAMSLENGSVKIETEIGKRAPVFKALCEKMLTAYKNGGDSYPFLMKALVFEFFGEIIEHHAYEKSDPSSLSLLSGRMKQVIEYIEKNYSSEIKLEELAKTADMTKGHLCRSFKSLTGTTPFTYLSEYRLSRSCYELITSDRSVTEIALDCGFNDVSHYIVLFKKRYSLTPAKYRNQSKITLK